MRYLIPILFCATVCLFLNAEEPVKGAPTTEAVKVLTEKMRELSLRIFNIVQKNDAVDFGSVASRDFLKTANLEKLRQTHIARIRFDRLYEQDGEVRVRLAVAPEGLKNTDLSYIHQIYLFFVREGGEMKLKNYVYSGW